MKWACGVPGKAGTLWEGAIYPVTLEFSNDYPDKPPKCSFDAGFFHPNIYPSGRVCLSILDEEGGWKPSITVRQVLLGIQDLLDNPNDKSPAQERAYHLFINNQDMYLESVKAQAKTYANV